MDKTDVLGSQMLGQGERITANAHTHAVLELATLSLLIDQKIATLAEIENRVRQAHRKWPSEWDDAAVAARLDLLIGLLRDVYAPNSHGWTPQVIQGGLSRQKTD